MTAIKIKLMQSENWEWMDLQSNTSVVEMVVQIPFSRSETLLMRVLRVFSVLWRWTDVSLYSCDFSSSNSLTLLRRWPSRSPSLCCSRSRSSLGNEVPERLARSCCCCRQKMIYRKHYSVHLSVMFLHVLIHAENMIQFICKYWAMPTIHYHLMKCE